MPTQFQFCSLFLLFYFHCTPSATHTIIIKQRKIVISLYVYFQIFLSFMCQLETHTHSLAFKSRKWPKPTRYRTVRARVSECKKVDIILICISMHSFTTKNIFSFVHSHVCILIYRCFSVGLLAATHDTHENLRGELVSVMLQFSHYFLLGWILLRFHNEMETKFRVVNNWFYGIVEEVNDGDFGRIAIFT